METKRVTRYQLAWNLEKNVGSVLLYIEGVEKPITRDLDSADFMAIGILLGATPDAEVAIGKTPEGDSYIVGGKRNIPIPK